MLCIGFGEAQTGEGLSPQRDAGERTPHPIEFRSTVNAALSRKRRGRSHWYRDVACEVSELRQVPHSAASATGASWARSTTQRIRTTLRVIDLARETPVAEAAE